MSTLFNSRYYELFKYPSKTFKCKKKSTFMNHDDCTKQIVCMYEYVNKRINSTDVSL